MSKVPDQELKRAFTELHEKALDTTEKIKLANIAIENLKIRKKRMELTIKELSGLPQNTRTFASVGRMFLLDTMSNILADLLQQAETIQEQIESLENSKISVERNLKECKNNLREVVQQRQSKETSG